MKFTGPVLIVNDIHKSRRFYEEVMEMKIQFDFGECVIYVGGLSLLENKMALQASQNKLTTSEIPETGVEMVFETDDIENDFKKIQAANVTFIHEIMTQPWLQRVFRFYDLDNHAIEVGDTLEMIVRRALQGGMSKQQLHTSTMMPMELIDSVTL